MKSRFRFPAVLLVLVCAFAAGTTNVHAGDGRRAPVRRARASVAKVVEIPIDKVQVETHGALPAVLQRRQARAMRSLERRRGRATRPLAGGVVAHHANAEEALQQVARSRFVEKALEHHPYLSLHAAHLPALAALVREDEGLRAAVLRSTDAHPAHPMHRKGTRAVTVGDLVDHPELLAKAIRPPNRDVGELEHFVDGFIRPSVRTCRYLIDDYGIGLFDLDRDRLTFEVSDAGTVTGRVVLPDASEMHPDATLMAAKVRSIPKKQIAAVGAYDTEAAGAGGIAGERGLVQNGL